MNTETRCRPWCRQLLAAAVALSLSPTLAFAGDFSASVDARYRYEHVDDDAFANSADAHTLRLRVGGIWQWSPQWSLHGTLEQTSNLNDGFNSTRNGETSYPVVADPRSTERDELFVAYGSERLQARLGRQVINLDNQRYIGAVGWRQNRQSFDGIALDYDVGEQRQLSYRYLSRVIRVFGEHHPNDVLAHRDLDGHLFHFSHPAFDGRLVEYVYRVEDHDVATDSNTTVGLRYTRDAKAVGNWSLGLDLARQQANADNPLDGSATYWRIEPGYRFEAISLQGGWERLGGDGGYSFRTPLATGHAFNGWADRFLATPLDGLDDRFIGVNGKLGESTWSATAHRFDAVHGDARFGDELDLSLARDLGHGFKGLLKLADFRGDALPDVRKLWLQIDYHY
ncbi:MAG: alginate export family protein [Rhodanobacteraceae bacterium]|nr:alginate export family protein [Xanthomonadales bacterium]MCP5478523.1 alginate export family protein [Rhodanobacteraceae bacterium]HPF73324.1 alginate export family protein [Xanthomonadaceae bacterium]HRX98754.1 alginate export family protein [Xanthomonadaceae bacterium]